LSGFYTFYISLPLIFISALVLVMAYFTKREDSSYNYFTFLCVTTLIWNVFNALYAVSNDIALAELFFLLQMIAVPYMPVALLMFALKFSGFERVSRLKYALLACVLPSITVIMNFTNDYHYLFRASFEIIQITPTRVMINVRGPWFWVHTVYSYVAILAANLVIIYKIRNVVRASRLRYYMILLGSSFSIFINLFVVFVRPTAPIDSTLWGVTLGLLFIYFAMDTSLTSNYILARNEVFEAIGEYIFVLNMSGVITDINIPARKWLSSHGIDSDPSTLLMLLTQLKDKGAIIENDDGIRSFELYFPAVEGSAFSAFTIKRHFIYDKKQNAVGTIITFTNMTEIREALRNLQAVSTIDVLTGAYNRRAYEKILNDYNENSLLPLCIVMGDVNGLKTINDTLGHSFGDKVLGNVARLLSECLDGNGTLARIGGDEFALIVPDYGEAEASALINCIKTSLADKADELHGASIALGYALKTKPHQDLKNIIDEADANMYQDKRNDRRQRRT